MFTSACDGSLNATSRGCGDDFWDGELQYGGQEKQFTYVG